MKKDTSLLCINHSISCSSVSDATGDWSPHRSTHDPKAWFDSTSPISNLQHHHESQDQHSIIIPNLRQSPVAFQQCHSGINQHSGPELKFREFQDDSSLVETEPVSSVKKVTTQEVAPSSAIDVPPTMVRMVSLDPPLPLAGTGLIILPSQSRTKRRRNSSFMSEDGHRACGSIQNGNSNSQPMEEDSPVPSAQSRKRRRLHERKRALGTSEFADILGQLGPLPGL